MDCEHYNGVGLYHQKVRVHCKMDGDGHTRVERIQMDGWMGINLAKLSKGYGRDDEMGTADQMELCVLTASLQWDNV